LERAGTRGRNNQVSAGGLFADKSDVSPADRDSMAVERAAEGTPEVL
jgi:hypothetical protein